MAPSTEIRYGRRLPYFREKGCQNSKLHPKNRYIYPVPSLSAEMEIPDDSDSGTSTEYTTETAIPANQV